VSVRAIRRDPPDLKKLSQALISLALAQSETEARRAHEQRTEERQQERGDAE
jgi:hypothetical protein